MTCQESTSPRPTDPIGRLDRARTPPEGRADDPPPKTPAPKSESLGDRDHEAKVGSLERFRHSLQTDYIEAKRKAAQDDSGRPPWWPRFR
jgi:hypothetical protein